MDVLAVTDFPDIRLKAAIQSANDGSVLIIPGKAAIWSASCRARQAQGGRTDRGPEHHRRLT